MIDLEVAQAKVLTRVHRLQPVEMSLRDALGCVLADDAVATEAIPPFANTAVDGYAVRAEDVREVPIELEVVGELRAGRWPDTSVGIGQAMRIMTGSPIPDGS